MWVEEEEEEENTQQILANLDREIEQPRAPRARATFRR